MYVNRKLEKDLINYIKAPEILAIVGPRQSGKTTMIKHIKENLENSVYISFEDVNRLELFENDIDKFMDEFKGFRYIIIDEFQYSRKGGKNLKYIFDFFPDKKIIISGSSTIDLTINAIKYLVGRVFVFNLYQFDFEEFLSCKDEFLFKTYKEYKSGFDIDKKRIKIPVITDVINKRFFKLLDEFIIWGGYPRVVLSGSEDEKKKILTSIFSTFFLRDIKDIAGLSVDFKLTALLKALALQNTQLIAYNELSSLSGYDNRTLRKFLNLIYKTYICKFVTPFIGNKRSEIIKNPKVFFFDSGLRNSIINNFNSLQNRTDKGSLFENFVFTQLIKASKEPKFWRTKSKAEVDFVIEENGKIYAIECKSGIQNEGLTKAIHSFIDKYNPENVYVANMFHTGKVKNKSNVYFLPHWLI